MSGWTAAELAAIGGATELEISSRRADGTLRPFVPVWVVRSGDELYVRSAYGAANGWYRRALAAGFGQIRAGGLTRDVSFVAETIDVDHAYHTKYDRYGPAIVGTVVGPAVAALTIRLQKETPS
ncbi:DUF2255 family protein [Actinoplanes sp. NPDC026619]|uniref:DUF2255 family protein n=1 Tax=Actinoplanes sp. NPDC026619 TaxID=3155798 RepID=UPI0033FF4083